MPCTRRSSGSTKKERPQRQPGARKQARLPRGSATRKNHRVFDRQRESRGRRDRLVAAPPRIATGAGGGLRRPAARRRRIVLLVEFEAALQNVTETAQDRHVRVARGLYALPVAVARTVDEMAHEAGGKHPARQVAGASIALEAAREVAAD